MRHYLKTSVLKRAWRLVILDALSVVAAFWIALAFRFDGQIPSNYARAMVTALPFTVAGYVAVNTLGGLYGRLWRYTSAYDVSIIAMASGGTTCILLGLSLAQSGARSVPLSVVALGGMLSFGLFTMVRYRQRLLTGLMGRLQQVVGSPHRQRVLIVGAGKVGELLARQLKVVGQRERPYELVGFIDDDPEKRGLRMHGAPVLGGREAIPQVVQERGVGLIIIAIHNISGPALRDILSICLTTPARVKILPDFLGNIDNVGQALPPRNITAEDLLGRELSPVDEAACRGIIEGKVVLVTGAAGSIGSELCRQVLALGPRRLVMLDNNESGLHDLAISLRGGAEQVTPVLADVTDDIRLEHIFATYRPQIVFHAAAYKHVPLMEHYPDEAVRVNVLGTWLVTEFATRYAVERFVLISTDKAVNPSSVMGATKRVCELMILSNSRHGAGSGTSPLFTAVRFGNVLGSRGSVVPTFQRQIEAGGPVTITHPEMTRYFISVSEAVSLVIQAAAFTEGGDIFMLDMGQPIRIEDLAYKMIRLRGLRPGVDIPIVYTGMRPGEKLHEELSTAHEERLPTSHPKIFRIRSRRLPDGDSVTGWVDRLAGLAVEHDTGALVEGLRALLRDDGTRQPALIAGVGRLDSSPSVTCNRSN